MVFMHDINYWPKFFTGEVQQFGHKESVWIWECDWTWWLFPLCSALQKAIGQVSIRMVAEWNINIHFRTKDLIDRCSLTTSRRQRRGLFGILCTEEVISTKQMRHDIIENYMRVKCRITVGNFRTSFKFSCPVSSNLQWVYMIGVGVNVLCALGG